MDTKRLVILKRLCAWLEGVTPANINPGTGEAYEDDLDGKVVRGRTTVGEELEFPFLAILDVPKPADGKPVGEGRTRRKTPWTILVQGFVKDDKVNPTDPAEVLLGQVQARLAQLVTLNDRGDPVDKENYLLGRIIESLTIGDGIVRPADAQVSNNSFFYLPLIVETWFNPSNPYDLT